MQFKTSTKKHLAVHAALILGAVTMLVPFLWMVITSLKTLADFLARHAAADAFGAHRAFHLYGSLRVEGPHVAAHRQHVA